MFGPLSRDSIEIPSIGSNWLRGVVGALVPETCPLCGRSAPPNDKDRACSDCIERLPRVSRYCRRCSAPAGPFIDTTAGCGHCRRDPFAFEAAFAVCGYEDLMRCAVLAAKRAGGGPAARWLADQIWEARGKELSSLGIDLVVPVPQHWTRRLVAPHNTAELIGRRLARRLKGRFGRHILIKVRRTPQQTTLTPSARRENMRGAFAALRQLDGRRILLVDDVLTTGTTAHRASRALLDAGAEVVWVAAAARGIGH